MSWLIGNVDALGPTSAKTALLMVTALAGLRFAERRTLARLRPFDVVTVIAVGAVIGRTATSNSTSYVQGAVALAVLFAVHQILSRARYYPRLRGLTEHRIRVLVRDGRMLTTQLHWCGLTRSDVEAALREQGVTDIADVRLLLHEAEGAFTVVGGDQSGDLLKAAIRAAAHGPE